MIPEGNDGSATQPASARDEEERNLQEAQVRKLMFALASVGRHPRHSCGNLKFQSRLPPKWHA